MKSLNLIFFGTAEFAVPSLEALCDSVHKVVAVVTVPDKPKGRGLKLSPSPVKIAALQRNLPVLQPSKLKAPSFLKTLSQYNADLQVVVAFRILPIEVWDMPPLGTFNLHAALLPQYKGAAPINWALIHGEVETGVTTFLLDSGIDTGKLLFQRKIVISSEDNAGSVYERLKLLGADLVVSTTDAIATGNYKPIAQPKPSFQLYKAPKITKEMCQIDWSKSAIEINDFIRGLSPYPGAWFIFQGKVLKIFRAHIVENDSEDLLKPGEFFSDGKQYIYVGTGKGKISIEKIQKEGKKVMDIISFLRGNKFFL